MSDSARPIVRSERFVTEAMRAWGDMVWRLAWARTGSRADTDDVYQDVFLSLARDASDLDDPDHLKAWLLRVTINRCRELHRTAWRRRTASLDDADATKLASLTDPRAAAAFEQVERTEIWHAVSRLKPKYREVIHLHYQEELSCDAIAEVLGVSASTVATRLQRARNQLRTHLEGM